MSAKSRSSLRGPKAKAALLRGPTQTPLSGLLPIRLPAKKPKTVACHLPIKLLQAVDALDRVEDERRVRFVFSGRGEGKKKKKSRNSKKKKLVAHSVGIEPTNLLIRSQAPFQLGHECYLLRGDQK
jgi:hypothetical protein